jgi:hypothetical protein
LVLGLLAAGAAQAQFAMVPSPLCVAPHQSATADEEQYRIDAARHLYTCFPMRVFRGRVPPLLYGVMVVDIAIGADGAVSGVDVIRKPAAEEVEPWVVAMIRRAAPFPAPAKLPGGTVHFTETFVVDKSGLFQVMSLAEGQRDH